MLRLLQIENIAVVERAEVQFGDGLAVLTGETGAGKSIVIDAINLVLGERSSRDVIRSGAGYAMVSALFDGLSDAVEQLLRENGFECGGELLLSRRLGADGKSVCRINGQVTTAALVKLLGGLLLNIHGQHDNQELLQERYHLEYLDLFGGLGARRGEYLLAYNALRETEREILRLSAGEEEKARRMDTLRFCIDEIDAAALTDGEEEELAARRGVLRNAEALASAVGDAYELMYGGDDTAGACAACADASDTLSDAVSQDPSLADIAGRLAELRYAASDIADELRTLRGEYEASPEELDRVETRLELIREMKRKYGASITEVLETLERYRTELDDIAFADKKLEKLEALLEIRRGAARRLADELSAARHTAAAKLRERTLSELGDLDMPRALFFVKLTEIELCETGGDACGFYISANAGEEPRPIARVASGGELARLMLALKSVFADCGGGVDTMVFDEVDAGVSGRAAQRVAEKMAKVSRRRQVLAVTHLPQIAAMADLHLLVEKAERDGRTYTSLIPLDGEGRVREVARVISGASVTEATLNAAREMICAAGEYRRGL